MTTKELKTLREKIAALSSGVYYDDIYEWWTALNEVLQNYIPWGKFRLFIDECPRVYNDEGRNILKFGIDDVDYSVFWTYYRMPSGRWEIICYLT